MASIALVTGTSTGIGLSTAVQLAKAGFTVVATMRNLDKAERLRARAAEEGVQLDIRALDVESDTSVRQCVEGVLRDHGRIDVLVNNAAWQGKKVEKFEELTAERLERTFRTNILAMFHLVRYALPHMKEGASIINVASIQAYQPSPGILDYATTKGAIVTFTKGLAQELIERGIRVNAVAPGPVWTPLIPQSFDAEKVKKFGQQSPMGRPAQPVELAPSFVFLASNESTYVNGEILGVTGGQVLA